MYIMHSVTLETLKVKLSVYRPE